MDNSETKIKITVVTSHNDKQIFCQKGQYLMWVLKEAGLPVASSCRGVGVCARCRVTIIDGEGNLSPRGETELFIAQKNYFSDNERLSCQAQVLGPVTLTATYW